ncbi:hypothetical protein Tco_1252448 [Tanacetum coccineum]
MIPQAVLMWSGLKTINDVRSRAAVNAAKPKAVHNAVKRNSTANPKVKTTDDSIEDIAAETLVYIRRSAAKAKDKGKAKMEESESAMTKTKRQQE